MAIRRRKKKLKPRPPNVDDLWAERVREECAKAMARWMRETINVKRPIESLKLEEMKNLAEACNSAWIVAQSKRIAEQPESDEALVYGALLV